MSRPLIVRPEAEAEMAGVRGCLLRGGWNSVCDMRTLTIASLALLAVGCRTSRIREHDSRTAAALHEMIIPGIGIPTPAPIADVVAFLQGAVDVYSNHFNSITIVVEEPARNCQVTNDWPTLSGRRHRADEYLTMISRSAPVSIDINRNEVRISASRD